MLECESLGETLKDRFRGPDGAVGGGVCPLCTEAGAPWNNPASNLGEVKGGLGEVAARAGEAREALGPVGAARSGKRGTWGGFGDVC